MENPKWLIYSREHNAWWRSERAGYTTAIYDAGRYSREEAAKLVAMRDPQPDGTVSEFYMLAPEEAEALPGFIEQVRGLMNDVRGLNRDFGRPK